MLTCTCSAQYVAMDLLQSLGCHGPARPVGWHGPPATCTPAQLSTLSRKCSALWADLDLLRSVGSLLGSVHCHGPAQLSRLTRTCSVHCVAVDVLSSFGCHGSARLNRSRAGRAQYVATDLLSSLDWHGPAWCTGSTAQLSHDMDSLKPARTVSNPSWELSSRARKRVEAQSCGIFPLLVL